MGEEVREAADSLGMTWIQFGTLSIFVNRRAHQALTRWGSMVEARGRSVQLAEWVQCCDVDRVREIQRVEQIVSAPTPVPILGRMFLTGYYVFGQGPDELSKITGVPVEDTYSVMERAVRAFALEFARKDVQHLTGSPLVT